MARTDALARLPGAVPVTPPVGPAQAARRGAVACSVASALAALGMLLAAGGAHAQASGGSGAGGSGAGSAGGTGAGTGLSPSSSGWFGSLVDTVSGRVSNTVDAAAAVAPTASLITGVRSGLSWSDNLSLAPAGSEHSGFVAEVSPYARYTANGSSLRGTGYVTLRNFFRTQGEDVTLGRFEANGNFTAKLYDDWLWLDAYGRIGNVSASPVGPLSYDPAASGTNVTTVRTYGLSPYVRSRAPWFDYELRYRYTTSNLSSAFYGQTQQSAIASGNTGTRLGRWSLAYYGDITQSTLGDGRTLGRRTSAGTLGYAVNPELRVGATVTYEQVDNLRGSNGRDWGVGPGVFVDWRPNTRFSLYAQASRRFYGTTSSASANWRTRQSTWSLTYSRAVLSSADASLLFFDPTSLGSTTPGAANFNPITALLYRQSLLLFGVTPLDLSVVSNALVLDKRLVASGGLTGARNSLVGNVFYNTRDSVGSFEQTLSTGGGGPRGGGTSALGIGVVLNGRYTQRGATLTYQHRLDTASSIDLTGRYTRFRVEGLLNGLALPGETSLTQLLASWSTRLTTATTGSFGLRRSQQRHEGTGTDYTENAVFGTLDTRF